MKIEIWSDVACPFCYIGKRRLEMALEGFPHKDEVEIEWKSFQLNPDLKALPGQSLFEYLSKTKGWSMDHTIKANEQVKLMAEEVGLHYKLENVKVANTGKAHRVLQLSKTKGSAPELEEALFKAYFIDGLDLDDKDTLTKIAIQAGLTETDVDNALEDEKYLLGIREDYYESVQIGVQGVPFFVFDNKYGISGAQPLEVFTRTLEQTYKA